MFQFFVSTWFPLLAREGIPGFPYPWQVDATRAFCHSEVSQVVALDASRRTGKTTLVGAWSSGLAWLFSRGMPEYRDLALMFRPFHKPYHGLHVGFEAPQSRKVFDDIMDIVRLLPEPIRKGFKARVSDPVIVVGEGSIRFGSTSDDKGKGMEGDYYDFIHLEEAGFHDEYAYSRSLKPMIADSRGRLVLSGKKWLGWYTNELERLRGIGVAFRIRTDDPQITPNIRSFAIDQRGLMDHRDWEAEFGDGVGDERGRFFPAEYVQSARSYPDVLTPAHPRSGHCYLLAWDEAISADNSVFGVFDVTEDRVMLVELLVLRGKYEVQAPKVLPLFATYKPYMLRYDATRIRTLAVDFWKTRLVDAGLDVPRFDPVVFTSRNKTEMATNLRMRMADGRYVFHPKERLHAAELENFGFTAMPGGSLRLGAASGHDDTVTVAMLGCHDARALGSGGRTDSAPEVGTLEWFQSMVKWQKKHSARFGGRSAWK